jgi:hypothetical protein
MRVFCRLRNLITVLSVALVATDAIVGVWGHSHAHPLADCAVAVDCHHHGGCSHSHPWTPTSRTQNSEPSDSRDSQPHDDCALCRHFSQPAALIAFTPTITSGDWIEPFVPACVRSCLTIFTSTHDARGPPSFCA